MEATYKQIDKSIADVAWEWFDKENIVEFLAYLDKMFKKYKI